jgi:hypothetical protein
VDDRGSRDRRRRVRRRCDRRVCDARIGHRQSPLSSLLTTSTLKPRRLQRSPWRWEARLGTPATDRPAVSGSGDDQVVGAIAHVSRGSDRPILAGGLAKTAFPPGAA